MAADHGIDVPAGNADADGFVPFGGAGEIRRAEPFDVVGGGGRQVVAVRRHPADPAGERAPIADRRGQRVAALDPLGGWAIEPH